MNEEEDKKKQVIGLYGEMQLSMLLHSRGWQVHRGYIDEGIDFVITKYWCKNCKKFSNQFIRNQIYDGKKRKCLTNLCEFCEKDTLSIFSKYLQIKTSEGVATKDENIRNFSFHPKIRYDINKQLYYVWIAVFLDYENVSDKINNSSVLHYYIFRADEVNKFDNMNIATYQITDNQKTTLKINKNGEVLSRGRIYNYDCFKEFHNNFDLFDK